VTWQQWVNGVWVVRYKVSDYYFEVDNIVSQLPGEEKTATSNRISGHQLYPAVTGYLNLNQFVIVWKNQEGNKVVARLFDSDRPLTNDFVVAEVPGAQFGLPSVAPYYRGWVVAWQDSNQAVWTKVFNGKEGGPLVKLNSTPVGTQPSIPMIAGRPYDTSLLAAWESNQIDGSGYGITSRTFGCSL